MKKNKTFAVFYMFVVTAFFSAILIGISRQTRQRVEANEQLAFEKAILNVFPDISYSSDRLAHALFEEKFQLLQEAGGTYVYQENGSVSGYAVPISGKGFWAPIRGIVGIAPNHKTITGLAFYEQNETPGLGARIEEPDFCAQFHGLQLRSEGPLVELRPEGSELSEGQVHAISGATQTCVRLEVLLNEDLLAWREAMNNAEVQP